MVECVCECMLLCVLTTYYSVYSALAWCLNVVLAVCTGGYVPRLRQDQVRLHVCTCPHTCLGEAMDDSSVSDPEGKTAAASKSHVSSPLPILSSLVPSATSSPWSSFHSSLTLVARGPGTPVRRTPHSHSEALSSPKSSPSRSSAPSAVVEFQNHFTELDLLLE